jgi:hypothetical protein
MNTVIFHKCLGIYYQMRDCQYLKENPERSYFFSYLVSKSVRPVWSRDSSVGIPTGWTVGVRFPAAARNFSLFHSVQIGSGAHPVSYTMRNGGLFPEGKEAGS